jgi:hypothetical protein
VGVFQSQGQRRDSFGGPAKARPAVGESGQDN